MCMRLTCLARSSAKATLGSRTTAASRFPCLPLSISGHLRCLDFVSSLVGLNRGGALHCGNSSGFWCSCGLA